MIKTTPMTKKAYQLFAEGSLAFARAERQGLRIDVEYCQQQTEKLTNRIRKLQEKAEQSKFGRHWKHIYGEKYNFNSNHQIAHILYDIKKITPVKTTDSGRGSTDEEALSALDIPELDMIIKVRKLMKIRDTYLGAYMREQVNGVLHPSFNLHLVRTFRSCVAKGTKILVCRDFEESPDGIPIEQVCKGDYVYCFDNNLNPAIRKVLWAGKTGYREVIRIHYTERGGGGSGYLDVTPEHKIRLIDGSYVPAKELKGDVDFRKPYESQRLPKIRTLSCKRVGDTLRFTGHLKYGNGLLEHRFIYEHFEEPLKTGEIIHHKNGRHLDHRLKNLEKTNLSKHSSFHSKNAPYWIKKKRIEALHKNRHKIKYKKGLGHPCSLNLSKVDCLRELARIKGRISKTQYDFTTFKNYVHAHRIDPSIVRLRYDRNGKFVSKQRLEKLSVLGRAKVSKILGIGYERLLQLYDFYRIPTDRKWANQFGEFKPGNHIVTKVEYINKKVDVYDIEVEEFHNFFANEICVHNSSDSPNLQNVPKRDEQAKKITRSAIFPRIGHQFVGMDFSGIEVRMAGIYTQDENLIYDIFHGDMHKDMAVELYMLDSLDKRHPGEANLRQGGKNGFVFPQFYGDYYGNCAPNLLKWAEKAYLHDDTSALVHLEKKGLIKLNKKGVIRNSDKFIVHVKQVEDYFWNTRYKTYTKWKNKIWKFYQSHGYIDMFTGFRCFGLMNKRDVTNYPFQGTAFHCLLKVFIELDKAAYSEGWDSFPVFQVHDDVVLDVNPNEREMVEQRMHYLATEELANQWKWINVPLDVEMEKGEVDQSLYEKKFYAPGLK